MEERPTKCQRIIKPYTMEMITLVSNEGGKFPFPREYIEMRWKTHNISELIYVMCEDMGEGEELNLYDCRSLSLRIFIEFSKLFEELGLEEFNAPLPSNKLTDAGIDQEYVDFLEEQFDNVGLEALCNTCEDMHYIECRPLEHLIAAFIASKIKDLDEDEIEVLFGGFLKKTETVSEEPASAAAGAGC